MSKYKAIIDKLFEANKSFNREDFLEFISDLTGRYPDQILSNPASLDSDGNKYYREDISIFEDSSGEKIAILSYKMPSASKVEKARSHQRNLISNYLKNEGVFEGVESVLVAFYSDNHPDWRLSFVKQEFKLSETERDAKGRKKIVNELTPAKRFSFLIESKSRNITAKQRLHALLENSGILVGDIEKAFSVEKVSKEFFEKYVKLYEKLITAFKEDRIFSKIESESNNGDEQFRNNFVKKLLGQIVFLYFLQKKGWLGVGKDAQWGDGNKNFLQDLLTECLEGGDKKKELGGKNFFNDYLEHLFYAYLNQKRDQDYSEYFQCKIPYLNGGLFEPINNYHWQGLEYVVLAGEKNNILFKEIFDTFDEYNFTVYENDPLEQDVAVDPEMLGKVFENLLPENERKGKGAFYTPREIVHYMCKESLKNHIINKTGISEERIEKLFALKDSMLNLQKFNQKLSEEERYAHFGEFIDYAKNIIECLKTVKIVDPAVGSGAFPMGLLKEIVSLRKYLQENILLEENVSEYGIKKETLENCIYGVDLDPGAVEIAKLRFWLSLVIEEESSDTIDPLPNLDYKIMQGNSLIEDIVVGDTVIKIDLEDSTKKLEKNITQIEKRIASQGSLNLFSDENARDDILKRLKFLHKIFFQEKDNNKKKSIKIEIDHIEKELIRISGEVEVNRLRQQIDNIEGKYIISGMAWDEKEAKKVAAYYSQISSIKEMEEKYKKDNIRSFFPWKLHFGEVFNDNGGFDIVIGNPPYIDSEEMVKSQLKERNYISNNFEFTKGNWDIYIAFFEKGFKLLSKMGNLSYITPDKWLSKPFGIELRSNLINNIIGIVRAGRDVFETAKVDSIISFITNNKKDKISVCNYDGKEFNFIIDINKKGIKPPYVLDFIFSSYVDVLNKINSYDFSIGKLGNCENACATSDAYKLKDFVKSDLTLSKDNLKIVNTGTISKYITRWGKKDMTYLKDKYLYPYVDKKEFLLNFGNSYGKKSIKPKIIIKGLTLLDGALDLKGEFIPGKSTIIIHHEDLDILKFLAGFINSRLPFFFIKEMYSSSSYNGGINFSNDMIANLPIPVLSKDQQIPVIRLVDDILVKINDKDFDDSEEKQNQIKILESKINHLVYNLYNLSSEEIELVEKSLK